MSVTIDQLIASRGDHCTIETNATTFAQLSDALERARVVDVLNEWADADRKRSWEVRLSDGTVEARACCVLRGRGVDSYFGNFDSAMAAAAKAIESEKTR